MITKSIRIDDDENQILQKISQQEGVSEAVLLKKFVRQGMTAYRLDQAVTAYQNGEADLSAAARFANVSIYHFMNELTRRDITLPTEAEKFATGLAALVETFGGSEALRQTIGQS